MEKQEKLVREMGGVGISFILRKQGKVMECLVKEPLSLDSTEITVACMLKGVGDCMLWTHL